MTALNVEPVANALRRLGRQIPATADALRLLARVRPLGPHRELRFGKLTPKRAAELLPVGTPVRHYFLDLAGTVAPRADGVVYRPDVSGWCTVHVQWEDGRSFGVAPRELVVANRQRRNVMLPRIPGDDVSYLEADRTYQGFGVDGLVLCSACGVAVVDGWQPEHTRFHEALIALIPSNPAP
ncbi:hypothetical protein [Sphaerisporangium sp. NPDC051011]|uniref:hypothetical protein n=1 Tax=Sphaerisporangium sp. NPDC051011 TaxID=3155792 RepID=UPI0033FEDDEA